VVLRVRNPGPDLDKSTIARLFEPFTQRDGSATRPTDGAGMGLYVVRRLVEVHGGRLRMTSEGGEINVEVDMWAAEFPVPTADPTQLPRLPDLPGLRAEGFVEEPFLPVTNQPPAPRRPARWDRQTGYPAADVPDLTGLGGSGLGGTSLGGSILDATSGWPADDYPLDRSG
jgi:hypothetical protein